MLWKVEKKFNKTLSILSQRHVASSSQLHNLLFCHLKKHTKFLSFRPNLLLNINKTYVFVFLTACISVITPALQKICIFEINFCLTENISKNIGVLIFVEMLKLFFSLYNLTKVIIIFIVSSLRTINSHQHAFKITLLAALSLSYLGYCATFVSCLRSFAGLP